MYKERFRIAACIFFLVVGGVGSFFLGPLQQSLLVPMTMMRAMTVPLPPQPGTMKKATATVQARQQGMQRKQGAGKGTPHVMPTPKPTAMMGVVMQDNFQRGNQVWWGRASDGEYWGGDANTLNDFSIYNGVGRVVAIHDTVNALLGGAYNNEQVIGSMAINSFMLGEANVGVVLRWTDKDNWYKAYIDGSQFVILKSVGGQQEALAAMPFDANGEQTYSIRFQVSGTRLSAKVWSSDQGEPQQWMLTANDDALMNGRAGMRFVMVPDVVITVHTFFAQELLN
jgi:hypothetical protein